MMRRQYFTVTDLRASIAEINARLEECNFSFRMREAGRNGYQGVDEYFVHPDGTPHANGAVRNVCCGSSRECNDAAWQLYYIRFNRADREGLIKDLAQVQGR
jgi:hypothetical protein